MKLINWFFSLFSRKSQNVLIASAAAASVTTATSLGTASHESASITDSAPRSAVPRKKVSFRAPELRVRPHLTNDRKVLVNGAPWKMAHKVTADADGNIPFRRPHHPHGPVRFIPPRLLELAAA